MARSEENVRYDAKLKAEGWVRGPRISGDAADQLRLLAFRHRLNPAEVVTRLLLGLPLSENDPGQSFQQREGLSDEEMRTLDSNVGCRP